MRQKCTCSENRPETDHTLAHGMTRKCFTRIYGISYAALLVKRRDMGITRKLSLSELLALKYGKIPLIKPESCPSKLEEMLANKAGIGLQNMKKKDLPPESTDRINKNLLREAKMLEYLFTEYKSMMKEFSDLLGELYQNLAQRKESK